MGLTTAVVGDDHLAVADPRVITEIFQVLSAGGRICIAGVLSRQEYLNGLTAAGFTNATVRFTHQTADGMHSAIIQATKPRTSA